MNSALRPPPDAEPDEVSLFAAFESLRGRCPAPELVFALREGALPGEFQSLIFAHVEQCHACRTLAEAMASLPVDGMTVVERERILSRLRAGTPRAKPAQSWWSAWRVAITGVSAATILAVAVLGGWIAFGLIESPLPALPAGPSVARLEQPALLRLEKPPLPVSGVDLLWRGAPERPRIHDELAIALEPFGRDDFAESATRLRRLTAVYPGDPQVHFYLGVSELYLERHGEAIETLSASLRLAADDPELSATSTWYLALAYQRSGQRDRAIAMLERLCQGTTVRAAIGCAAHLELSKANRNAR